LKTRFFIYLTGFFLLGLALWTERFFGRVSIDQALWTINFGAKGVLAADSIFLKRFIIWAIIWPIILSIIFLLAERFITPRMRFTAPLFLLAGVLYFSYEYHAIDYFQKSRVRDKDYFFLNYVDANQQHFSAKNPKSLILIYVESLENNYAKPELFGHDLLKKLTHLQNNHVSFSQYQQVSGTGWTMGGLVSTQCAVPLKSLTIMGNNRVGENVSYFLPKVKCLGDILAEAGYKNIFMEGSSLFVGGKGKFLENHHYSERIGTDEWFAKGYPVSGMTWWGLPDDLLIHEAKLKFDKLMQDKQPFNLTILTVDMHGVSGQISPTCKSRGQTDFKGIVECTCDLVADLVNYMIDHHALARANIIVMGDHLAMSNDVIDVLQKTPRTIFNVIITRDKLHKHRETIVHFDWLPTILDTLGFEYSSHKLGLGVSAFVEDTNRQAKNALAHVEKQASYESEFYNQLWIPKQA